MINVNALFNFTEVLANSDQTGANFTPDNFNIVLPEAVYEVVREYYGIPKRQPAQPLLTFEKTQAIKDYLTPLLKMQRITVVEGMVLLPEDYMHLDDISYEYWQKVETVCSHCGSCSCDGICSNLPKGFIRRGKKSLPKPKMKKVLVPLTVVNNSQWSNLFTDSINYPIDSEPYAQFIGEDVSVVTSGDDPPVVTTTRKIMMEVAPQTIPQVIVRYLKLTVPEPHWGSIASQGYAVYDPATSVDIPLPRILLQELSWIILEMCGIHTREYWMQQLAQSKIVQGV